ncbi:MAG: GNAT family N-acetyltransferase [Bdellovibrionales bacterium]|nr:GNAT family N-acetyltransferase [Bdellovibrionales bacterium]
MEIRLPAAFRTPRLELRPFTLADHAAWKAAHEARLPDVYAYDAPPRTPEELTRAAFAKRVRTHREMRKTDRFYCLGVFLRKTGEYLGAVDVFVILRGDIQWGNLGYSLMNQHYGKGYGREAARAGLEISFKHLKLHRLEAAINLDNRPSIRLARAIGMEREGLRRAFIFEKGKWADHVVFVARPESIGMRSSRPG